MVGGDWNTTVHVRGSAVEMMTAAESAGWHHCSAHADGERKTFVRGDGQIDRLFCHDWNETDHEAAVLGTDFMHSDHAALVVEL